MPTSHPEPTDPFALVREVRRLGVEVARARGRGEGEPARESRLAELRARLLAPGPRPAPIQAVCSAIKHFPVHVHALRRHIGLAAACFWLAAILGFAAVAFDPLAATWLLPDAVRVSVVARLADGSAWLEQVDVTGAPALSGSLLIRNVEAAMEALAFGVLAGVGAVVAMVRNGVFLGAVAGLVHAQGLDRVLWAFVAPHGVLELPAVWLAGGAGLALGEAVLLPGPRGRTASLRVAARHAGPVGVALIPLLVAAALIEGFISPIPKPDSVSFGMAALLGLALTAYLATGWRSASDRVPASSTATPEARQRSAARRR